MTERHWFFDEFHQLEKRDAFFPTKPRDGIEEFFKDREDGWLPNFIYFMDKPYRDRYVGIYKPRIGKILAYYNEAMSVIFPCLKMSHGDLSDWWISKDLDQVLDKPRPAKVHFGVEDVSTRTVLYQPRRSGKRTMLKFLSAPTGPNPVIVNGIKGFRGMSRSLSSEAFFRAEMFEVEMGRLILDTLSTSDKLPKLK